MPHRLDGKCALITGGASGLGRAIAAAFIAEGAKVLITDINEDALAATAADLGGVAHWQQDVTDEDAWVTTLDRMESEFGGIHVLVNNAGIGLAGGIEDTSLDAWRKVHAVDLDSVFLGCKHSVRRIDKAGGGSVVNISSVAGLIATPFMPAYHSSKAAVRHFSKSVALYCAKMKLKVRSNSVHPAFINTPILDGVIPGASREETIESLAKYNPLKRIGEPDEVAWPVVFLASDESSYINGTELVIDGGLTAA